MANKSTVYYLTVDPAFEGQRIDNFLITQLKIPKTRIYRLLRKGEVRVNKKRAEPSYRLQAEDQIRIPPLRIEEEKEATLLPTRLRDLLVSRIIYEDKGLFIINKPAGIAVHGGTNQPWGIVEILKTVYPQLPQLELVHRLDRDTSGCLMIAKKRSVLREIHELLREGKGAIKKEYWTLTKGSWAEKDLSVDAPLMKNILTSGERMVKVHSEGKASKTVFEVIEKYKDCTLVRAKLLTGRTHQIRVHALYKGHPVAGDEKYGDKEFNKEMKQKGLKRLFLHAHTLAFVLPSTGEEIRVTSPLDADLAECLKLLI